MNSIEPLVIVNDEVLTAVRQNNDLTFGVQERIGNNPPELRRNKILHALTKNTCCDFVGKNTPFFFPLGNC